MKLHHLLLPPVAALIAGSLWMNLLASAYCQLRQANTELRERIASAKAGGGADSSVSIAEQQARSGRKAAAGKTPATHLSEWTQLADSMLRRELGGSPDTRLNLRLQARLMRMSAPEILATFDALAASGLSREGLAELHGMFFDAAAEKDPALALKHFENLLAESDPSLGGRLADSFGKWFGQDPAATTAWLDEMTAAGRFETKRLDGKNQTLMNCVGPVISALLASDPAASLARLKTLPENQRMEVLMRNFGRLTPGMELAYAGLARQGLPEDQRADGFCGIANLMVAEHGLAKVSAFLDTIGASAEERRATAVEVAAIGLLELHRSNRPINGLHDWLVQQAPETADRNFGSALATNLPQLGFEKAAALVTEFHQKTGSDQLLEAFLTNAPVRANGDQAMALAALIKDDALRERMQTRIILNTTKPPASATSP